MTLLICVLFALFGGFSLGRMVSTAPIVEDYIPNKALVYFTQWELQRPSPLTWCDDGHGFEVWCAAVDHYMEEELRGFPV